MSEFPRPLAGYSLSLSISENEDSTAQGFPDWQVNRLTLQLTAALFGQGVSILFGHNWRDDGVMQAVHGFAQQAQPPIRLSKDENSAEPQPLLLNCLPWPDNPYLYLSVEELEMLKPTLSITAMGLPQELESVRDKALSEGPDSRLYRYVRARALTVARKRLTELADARLCIGGRRSKTEGRYPGILEESLLALRVKKPLYLSGVLGGITKDIINAVEGQNPFAFHPTPIDDLELFTKPPIKEIDPKTQEDRESDVASVWQLFRSMGESEIARRNGLTEEENREMFHSDVVDHVIRLVLTGLGRLRTKPSA